MTTMIIENTKGSIVDKSLEKIFSFLVVDEVEISKLMRHFTRISVDFELTQTLRVRTSVKGG